MRAARLRRRGNRHEARADPKGQREKEADEALDLHVPLF